MKSHSKERGYKSNYEIYIGLWLQPGPASERFRAANLHLYKKWKEKALKTPWTKRSLPHYFRGMENYNQALLYSTPLLREGCSVRVIAHVYKELRVNHHSAEHLLLQEAPPNH